MKNAPNIVARMIQLRREIDERQTEYEHLRAIIVSRFPKTRPENLAPRTNPNSQHGKVLYATIDLLKRELRPVTNSEIMKFLKENGTIISPTLLAAVLAQELKKKKPLLKRVARGVYDLRKENE